MLNNLASLIIERFSQITRLHSAFSKVILRLFKEAPQPPVLAGLTPESG
jgi:hypothetical protein